LIFIKENGVKNVGFQISSLIGKAPDEKRTKH